MTETLREVLSSSLYSICLSLLSKGEPFNILVDNHNNWNEELPARLKNQTQFVLRIEEQTLEDSYIEDGVLFISTQFDKVDYVKEFEPADISAILNDKLSSAYVTKAFRELPTIEIKATPKNSEPSEEGVSNSMLAFKKNNPELFTNPDKED